jgi:hypothetical protein
VLIVQPRDDSQGFHEMKEHARERGVHQSRTFYAQPRQRGVSGRRNCEQAERIACIVEGKQSIKLIVNIITSYEVGELL